MLVPGGNAFTCREFHDAPESTPAYQKSSHLDSITDIHGRLEFDLTVATEQTLIPVHSDGDLCHNVAEQLKYPGAVNKISAVMGVLLSHSRAQRRGNCFRHTSTSPRPSAPHRASLQPVQFAQAEDIDPDALPGRPTRPRREPRVSGTRLAAPLGQRTDREIPLDEAAHPDRGHMVVGPAVGHHEPLAHGFLDAAGPGHIGTAPGGEIAAELVDQPAVRVVLQEWGDRRLDARREFRNIQVRFIVEVRYPETPAEIYETQFDSGLIGEGRCNGQNLPSVVDQILVAKETRSHIGVETDGPRRRSPFGTLPAPPSPAAATARRMTFASSGAYTSEKRGDLSSSSSIMAENSPMLLVT